MSIVPSREIYGKSGHERYERKIKAKSGMPQYRHKVWELDSIEVYSDGGMRIFLKDTEKGILTEIHGSDFKEYLVPVWLQDHMEVSD